MKKAILGIAIAGAFVIGILSANPVVEAVGGWQQAFIDHEADGSAHGIDSLSIGFGSSVFGPFVVVASATPVMSECPANHVMTGFTAQGLSMRPICKPLIVNP